VATDYRWVDRVVPLEFGLGPRAPLKLRFKGRIATLPHMSMPSLVDEGAVRDELARGEIAMIYSHPVPAPLRRAASVEGLIRYVPRQYPRFHARLTGSFEGYLGKFSSKSRETLRRKLRRFYARVDSAEPLREFRTAPELEAFHPLGRAVSSLTYQERFAQQGLPETPEYLRRWPDARAFLLLHGERPVAYLFVPIQDRVAFYQYVGYDPEYADHSPGTVLMYLALQRLFEDPAVEVFDFTEGGGAQKEFFATGSTLCADLYYFRPTAKARLTVAGHSAWSRLRATARWLAGVIGVRAPLRRLLRGASSRR
jgi:CelD/BcsL family acetyltransferase involved in cellulose biosynthesis